jgi:hypothetical protein
MAIVEETPNTSEGVFVVVCIMLAMMVGTYLFASFVIWSHEQTAQECIQNGRIWESDICMVR